MKTKFYYLVLLAGVGLIAVSFTRKNQAPDVIDISTQDEEKQEIIVDEENESGENHLEGVLYKSENVKLGNYKLLSDKKEIYLRTSRDFSALIGLPVLVTIEGSKDKFELVDIQAKVTDGGFIKER